MVDFFQIFVMSLNTCILIESNYWLGMYVLYILKSRFIQTLEHRRTVDKKKGRRTRLWVTNCSRRTEEWRKTELDEKLFALVKYIQEKIPGFGWNTVKVLFFFQVNDDFESEGSTQMGLAIFHGMRGRYVIFSQEGLIVGEGRDDRHTWMQEFMSGTAGRWLWMNCILFRCFLFRVLRNRGSKILGHYFILFLAEETFGLGIIEYFYLEFKLILGCKYLKLFAIF